MSCRRREIVEVSSNFGRKHKFSLAISAGFRYDKQERMFFPGRVCRLPRPFKHLPGRGVPEQLLPYRFPLLCGLERKITGKTNTGKGEAAFFSASLGKGTIIMEMDLQTVKEQICDVCHKMWQLGWVAANDGNVSARLEDGTFLATPTGISKSFITPEKLIRLDKDGKVLEAAQGFRPSSEIKMHLRCYEKRPDVASVLHAHPPGATGFAVAHRSMDMYNMIEDVAVLGSVPLTPYGTPSTSEVPDAIEPYLEEHDVMLLENHGALAVGSDVLTAFYRMESLELWAKITINAIILGGSYDISRENIQKLIDLRGFYRVTGRHPGYKKYPRQEEMPPTDQ